MENKSLQIDSVTIQKYIPHRYPFLLIDRVLTYVPSESMVAIKNVTVNEPFFNGHFPARPVMPGVLIVEALAQTVGILMAKTLDWPEGHSNFFYLAGVDNVRFKRVVEPGDQLRLEVSPINMRRNFWKCLGNASVDGELACSAEILIIRG